MDKQPNILHLIMKGKWYDMIASGEKKEEYRKIKPYWKKRLERDVLWTDCWSSKFKSFEFVCFHRGHTNKTMTFRILKIEKGHGNPEWGAPVGEEVYIIKLVGRIK